MRSVAVLLALVLLPAASAAPRHLPDEDRQQIAELAQRYLQHRADKITNIPQVSGFGVPTTEALAARLRVDEIKLEGRRLRHSSYPGGGNFRAETSTSLMRTTVAADGSVVAYVHEVTALYQQQAGTTYINKSIQALTHVFVFDRAANGWVLAVATEPPGTVCGLPAETEFCGQWSDR